MSLEYVYVEYDPEKPTNRYDLSTRKRVHAIELTCAETLTTSSSVAPAPAPAPPEIQSFERTDNISSLQVLPGADFTLRAMFTGGAGTLTATPAFPYASSYQFDSGVSYTYQTDVSRVYTLTVQNAAATSVSRTLAITVTSSAPAPTPVLSITSFVRYDMHYLYSRRILPADSYYTILTRGATMEMRATFVVPQQSHQTYIVAGVPNTNNPLWTPGVQRLFNSGDTATVTVPNTTPAVFTVFIVAYNFDGTTYTNQGYVEQSLSFTTVLPPVIQSFARMDNTSTLEVSPGANFTLRAMFTGGVGTLAATPAFPNASSLQFDSGVSYTYQTDVSQVYTLTVINGAGTSVLSTLAIVVVPDPVITSFAQDANMTIYPTVVVNLSASFSNGTGQITPGPHSIVTGGSIPVTPDVTTSYTLTVTNTLGVSTTSSLTITVFPRFTIVPDIIVPGDLFDLNFQIPAGASWSFDIYGGGVMLADPTYYYSLLNTTLDTTSVPGQDRYIATLKGPSPIDFYQRYGEWGWVHTFQLVAGSLTLAADLTVDGRSLQSGYP